MTGFPMNLIQVNQISKAAFSHPQMGWMVVASVFNPMIRFVATMAAKMTHARQKIVNSTEDALRFLNMVDQDLPDLTLIDLHQLTLYRRIEDQSHMEE